MTTNLDAGLFEPFRGKIISHNSDGLFVIEIPDGLMIDKEIASSIFDNAVIKWNHKGIRTFEGYPKTQEIIDILSGLFYSISIEFPTNPCCK